MVMSLKAANSSNLIKALVVLAAIVGVPLNAQSQAQADEPKIPLETLFAMIAPEWSNRDLKTGRALDSYLKLGLNSNENAIAYNLPSEPRHIMKSYQGGPGTYYFGVPIILDVKKDGREYAQCALIYKHYYLERRDQQLFASIGCDRGASQAHPIPTAFLTDLQKYSVENCGPGCRYHFVSSDSADKQALIQEIKGLYLDEHYNFDMLTLPKQAAEYKITYSVLGGDAFQSIEFDVVEEKVRGIASTFTLYRLQGPWQNHAALRYSADKNLYVQYFDQPPLGVMEALERDGELKRDIQLYVIADNEIIAHQDVSENIRRNQSIDENTRPEYNRKKPGLRYDGLDGRGGNIFIGGKDQFHHLLETHVGDVHVVWAEKTDTIEFARAWSFSLPGKTIVPENKSYKLSKRLRLEAGNSMTQDRNSDRYFWSVASKRGRDALELVETARWIPDPERLEQEATAAKMQADRERRDKERLDRKAEIAAENAARDARHEAHLQEVSDREKSVEAEVAAAQAAAMAEAEAELAKAQGMIDAAQGDSNGSGVWLLLRAVIAYTTAACLVMGGILFSRDALSTLLPKFKPALDGFFSLLGGLLPVIGVALVVGAFFGFLFSTLSLALFANIVPQATAVALGFILGTEKMLAIGATVQEKVVSPETADSTIEKANEALNAGTKKLGPILAIIERHKAAVGLTAIVIGVAALVLRGTWYVI